MGNKIWKNGYVSIYEYIPNPDIKTLKFEKMTDDTIYNYVQGFIEGKFSRAAFWELAKFKYPTHQISFHTARALATLRFVEGVEVQ